MHLLFAEQWLVNSLWEAKMGGMKGTAINASHVFVMVVAVCMGVWCDASEASAQATDTTARRATGNVSMNGVVTSADANRPVAGAQVRIVDGPRTTTDEQGAWTLSGVSPGLHTLEVAAVGYAFVRYAIVVGDSMPSIHITLHAQRETLDTVQVSGRRLSPDEGEFELRRRSGMGRYLTAADVARMQPTVTSDLFRAIAGVQLPDRAQYADAPIRVRGAVTSRRPDGSVTDVCTPALYINGMRYDSLPVGDLDTVVQPKQITGIEVYADASVPPPQFQAGLAGCGSIVIWTKPPTPTSRTDTKMQLALALGLVGIGFLLSSMLFRH